jgi:uncharacterized protein (TIGR03437 family)
VNRVFLPTLIVFLSLQLQAQPSVSKGGVVNVASYSFAGLPNGSIAQGSMFAVFGSNLGTTNSTGLSFPLPTTLNDTSIQVTSGSTTSNAIMIYTSPGFIQAILPSSTPVGTGTLTLTYKGQPSAPVDVQIVPSSFGAFAQNEGGSGPAVIQDFMSAADQPANTILSPAYPGQVVTLWGTGLGPVSYNDADQPPAVPVNMQTALNVQVWVGNKSATVEYAGRSGCCAGIDQVVFQVPQGVEGCYVPVIVEAGTPGVIGNVTAMAIASSAVGACSDADGIDSADVATLQSNGAVKLGALDLTHISLTLNLGTVQLTEISDVASGVFGSYSKAQLSASLGLTQSPAVGACTVSQFQGLDPLPVDPTVPAALDAGASLSINGPKGEQSIAGTSTGMYSATLGGVPLNDILSSTPKPAYLVPGAFTISGTGGSAIGSFSSPLTVPTDVTWTNSSSITTVDRTSDLTITWTGGVQGNFVAISVLGIVGGSLGPSATSPGEAVLCIAPAAAGSFTIPSYVLQALPPSTAPGAKASSIPDSYLLVGTQLPSVKFSASGLDDGYVTYRSLSGNSVTLQ